MARDKEAGGCIESKDPSKGNDEKGADRLYATAEIMSIYKSNYDKVIKLFEKNGSENDINAYLHICRSIEKAYGLINRIDNRSGYSG